MKKSRLLGAVCACILVLLTTTTTAAVLPLEGRLPATPGGIDYQAYYDPNLDITWAANANIYGFMLWNTANARTASLTIGGVTGWRLPSMDVNGDGTVVDCTGSGVGGCEDNEMGYLFWEEGITSAAQAPFSNIQDFRYWSGTESAGIAAIFDFFFLSGRNLGARTDSTYYAWPVRTGDVPLPPALWLFGSGLLGLIGIARKKAA